MDPVTAIGLASAIISFAVFGAQVLSGTIELRKSTSGLTEHNEDINYVVKKLGSLSADLQPTQATGSPSQDALNDIAAQCHKLAKELLAKLKKVQAAPGSNIWVTTRKALKSVWLKDSIDEMKARLDGLRDQMEIQVLVQMRNELAELQSSQNMQFDRLDQDTRQLYIALQKSSSDFVHVLAQQTLVLQGRFDNIEILLQHEGERTRRHIDLAVRLESSQQAGLLQLRETLNFSMIDARRDAIKPRHAQTFEWVFEENAKTPRSGQSFVQWLQGDGRDKVYWVSGKAGSGKSTLMNFIFEDPRLTENLRIWTCGEEPVVSSYFFWKSGEQLQNTLEGLLRTILFQSLLAHPVLLQDVLGHLYRPEMRTEGYNWSLAALNLCFKRLLAQDQTKIFLFIDGLDEFTGKHQDLVMLLEETSRLGESNTKICLSSRPLPLFDHAFRSRPGLCLQDLTREDITHFVKHELGFEMPKRDIFWWEMSTAEKISSSIVTKAQGVFIWVSTVVSSIQRGQIEFDNDEELLSRVEQLDDDIYNLYMQMLLQVEKARWGQQARLLQIMLYASQDRGDMQIPYTTVFDKCASEQDAINTSFNILTFNDYEGSIRRAQTQLQACCAGLIEVTRIDLPGQLTPAPRLSLSHHTVSEFLDSSGAEKMIFERLEDKEFDAPRAVLVAQLIHLKCPYTALAPQANVYTFLRAAKSVETGPSRLDTVLLDDFDRVMGLLTRHLLKRHLRNGKISPFAYKYWQQRHWMVSHALLSAKWALKKLDSANIRWDLNNLGRWGLLFLAEFYDLQSYVEAKLEEQVLDGGEREKRDFLLLRMLSRNQGVKRKAFETVLEKGINVNARLDAKTPWIAYVGKLFRLELSDHGRIMPLTMLRDYLDISQPEVCKLCVQYGALMDCSLWINISDDYGNPRPDPCVIVRCSVVQALANIRGEDFEAWLGSEDGLGSESMLQFVANTLGRPMSDFQPPATGWDIFEARCLPLSVYHASEFVHREVIDDGSYTQLEIDEMFAGKPLGAPAVTMRCRLERNDNAWVVRDLNGNLFDLALVQQLEPGFSMDWLYGSRSESEEEEGWDKGEDSSEEEGSEERSEGREGGA